MAKIHVTCPFCSTHLETPASNEGRPGQCPGCENVFEVHAAEFAPRQQQGAKLYEGPERRRFPTVPMEYGDNVMVLMAIAVVVAQLALAASTIIEWADVSGGLESFLNGERVAIMMASLTCGVFVAVSLFGRKSMAPPVLVGAAWGMTAAIWIAGLVVSLLQAAGEGENPVKAGTYVSLGLACLVLVLGAYMAFQFRGGYIISRVGVFFVALQGLGIVAGVLILMLHTRPALGLGKGAQGTIAKAQENHRRPRPVSVGREPTGRRNGGERGPAVQPKDRGKQTPPRRVEDPPKAEPDFIWKEGEMTFDNRFRRNDGFHRVNNRALSAWDWVSHYGPKEGTATWQIEAERGGKYTLWLRCLVEGVQLEFDLNQSGPVEIDVANVIGQKANVAHPRGGPKHMMAWVKADEVELIKGQNLLAVTLRAGEGTGGGIDCICLANFDWTPRGPMQPRLP